MQSPATTEEFEDFGTHKRMWDAFTRLMVRSLVGVVITLILVGLITGVL